MLRTLGIKVGLGAILMLLTVGCASQHIKGDELYGDVEGFRVSEKAKIEDSTKNREVLDIVYQYRDALVKKDFGTLKRLISKEYYDNAGTTDTTRDDYGQERLPEVLEALAKYAESIKYNVTIKRIEYKHSRVFVDYEFDYAYKHKVDEKPSWDAGTDVNRLELVQEEGRWKIVSGL